MLETINWQEGRSKTLQYISPTTCQKGLEEMYRNFGKNSYCMGLDSNSVPPLKNSYSLSRFANPILCLLRYRGADKSLARPGRKQATATEDFGFHISYL
jgi:hypothetical protein